MKTLKECKDEVARRRGYKEWELKIHENGDQFMDNLMDIVAELYASQFKTPSPSEVSAEEAITNEAFFNISPDVTPVSEREKLRNEFDVKFCYLTNEAHFKSMITPADVWDWFCNIIEKERSNAEEQIGSYRRGLKIITDNYKAQIQELQSIITSRDEVIKNREYELDGAVEKYRELQREVERLKTQKQ